MNKANRYWAQLEVDMVDTSGIIVPQGQDEAAYFERLRSGVREHATTPDRVSATVVEPGFPHRGLGTKIEGFLLAKTEGYWLIFEPKEREYYCFWGTDPENLGAYGVCGNPLYCWWT